MNKAVFLDRDGTINVEKHYLYKIEEFEFLPGALEAMQKLQDSGYLLIIITNQSGIARGYYTEEDYFRLNRWMEKQLEEKGIRISLSLFCPHHPSAKIEKYKVDCNCRKPKTGMFLEAIAKLNIDLAESYAVGDKIRDCAICTDTECHGFLIGNNEVPDIVEKVKNKEIRNVSWASDLKEAADIILLNQKNL